MSFLYFLIGTQVGIAVGLFWIGRSERTERPENLAHQGYREVDPADETEGGVL